MRRVMILLALMSTDELNAETLALATAPNFFEELLPAARISGSLIAGVQFHGISNGVLTVQANVPAAWAGEVACARVISIDGIYEATNEYTVPATWLGGLASLDYPTLHGKLLEEAQTDSIGLRVSRGPCEGKPLEITVGSWNARSDDTPAILVNSFQADVVFAYFGESSTPVRCAPIELGGRSAFDMRCPITVLPGMMTVDVEILRVSDGQAAPPMSFVLWLPVR